MERTMGLENHGIQTYTSEEFEMAHPRQNDYLSRRKLLVVTVLFLIAIMITMEL